MCPRTIPTSFGEPHSILIRQFTIPRPVTTPREWRFLLGLAWRWVPFGAAGGDGIAVGAATTFTSTVITISTVTRILAAAIVTISAAGMVLAAGIAMVLVGATVSEETAAASGVVIAPRLCLLAVVIASEVRETAGSIDRSIVAEHPIAIGPPQTGLGELPGVIH